MGIAITQQWVPQNPLGVGEQTAWSQNGPHRGVLPGCRKKNLSVTDQLLLLNPVEPEGGRHRSHSTTL